MTTTSVDSVLSVVSYIAEPGREPERPITRVGKSESIAGRPVTAVVRCLSPPQKAPGPQAEGLVGTSHRDGIKLFEVLPDSLRALGHLAGSAAESDHG